RPSTVCSCIPTTTGVQVLFTGSRSYRVRVEPHDGLVECVISGIDARDEKLLFESPEAVSVVSTFDDLGLKEDLIRGIYAYNFEKPSAIQQRAILPITQGRDVIVQAQSGTGK
ncbi:hypothetical protein B0H14DRAFT_2459657, partial [Mycena olivaceomarginata]